MSSDSGSAPPAGLGLTVAFLGPFLIGGVFDFLLQGVLLVLASNYFSTYGNKDNWENRWMVGLVNFLCLGKTVQTFIILWDTFIVNFNTNPTLIFIDQHHATATEPLTTSIVGVIVQLFFVLRLYRLLGKVWNRWIVYFILLAIAACMILGIVGAATLTHWILNPLPPTADAGAALEWFAQGNKSVVFMLSSVLAADALITLTIIVHLLWSKTGYSRTDNLISRLVKMTWRSALPPTICATLNLATYIAYDDANTMYMAWNMILAKLYAISVMYILNAREGIREDMDMPSYSTTSRGITGLSHKFDRSFTSPTTPSARKDDDFSLYATNSKSKSHTASLSLPGSTPKTDRSSTMAPTVSAAVDLEADLAKVDTRTSSSKSSVHHHAV